MVWAVYLYEPLEHSPLPPWDFAILIELLQSASSFLERFAALTSHFSGEGRFFVLYNLAVDAHWSLFGWSTVAWQLARFVEMAGVLVLVWHILRNFGASQLGAAFGCALFIGAAPAIQVWTLPQLMSWAGALLSLGAVALALRYQTTERWVGLAVGIAALLVAASYVSETFIATTPFVIAVAVCRRADGTIGWPIASKRNLTLASIAVCLTFLLVIVPAMLLRVASPSRAYAAQYAWEHVSLARLANVARAAVLPVTRLVLFPANLAFLGLILAGLWVGRVAALRAQTAWVIGLASLLPLAGILIYLPWPVYEGYYSFQFLLGPALATAWALTMIETRAQTLVKAGARVAVFVILAYATLFTRNAVARDRAGQRAAVSASTALTAYPQATAVVASVDPERYGYRGDALRRYAKVRGLGSLPHVIDASCKEAAVVPNDLPAVVLALPESCTEIQDSLGQPPEELRCSYRIRNWKTWHSAEHTHRVMIWPLMPLRPNVSSRHVESGCIRVTSS
jgi:hypothetical protein